MKAQGLLTGLILGMLLVAGVATAQDASVFNFKPEELNHKYGIQVHGTAGLFAFDDINDYYRFSTSPTYSSVTEADMGFGGGSALLYRSSERFRWHFGYNWLGQEQAEASFFDEGVTKVNQQTMTGGEFYVSGHYLIPLSSDDFHLFVGLGVSIVSATLDRSSALTSGIYNANGRALGGRAIVGAELMLTEKFGLTLAAGYRAANVGELQYEDRTAVDEDGEPIKQTLFWGAGNRKIGADFSGPFVQGGIRYYFPPATDWFTL